MKTVEGVTGRSLCAAAVLLAMAACSGDTGAATDQASDSQTEMGPTGSATASPARVTAEVGQPFAFDIEAGTGYVPVQVSIGKFQCGIKGYPFKALSVSGSIPNDAPASPSAGQQFCQVNLSVRNVGKQPLKDGARPADQASVVAGEVEYASNDLSDAIVFTYMSRASDSGKNNVGWFSGNLMNPGQSVNQIKIWEIPADLRPTGIVFPSATGGDVWVPVK